MDLMIPRIQLYSDLQNHTYFFEKPDFSSEIAVNFKSKVVKEPEKARDTLNHLLESFAQLDDEFSHKEISKIWSVYIYEQSQKGIHLKNEEVFFLLRYVITGNYVGAPIGETCQVIGKQETLDRIQDMIIRLDRLIEQQ